MENQIEEKLTLLQKSFTNIIDIRLDVTNTLSSLQTVTRNLTEIYSNLIKVNQEKIFVFGLDSLRFQCKLIDAEYDDMKRLFLLINNRMYCEYFKLYRIVSEYITENISDKELLVKESYPIYKDLEPFKNYEFELIQSVHESIVTMLLGLYSYYLNRSHDLRNYKEKNKTGINIDNFVYTFEHNIFAIKEKILLFIQYVEFFHKLHNKYLKRFATKLHLMSNLINNDIKFEATTKEKQRNFLEEIINDNIDNEILLEVKENIQSNSPKNDDDTLSSITNDDEKEEPPEKEEIQEEENKTPEEEKDEIPEEEPVAKPPTFTRK